MFRILEVCRTCAFKNTVAISSNFDRVIQYTAYDILCHLKRILTHHLPYKSDFGQYESKNDLFQQSPRILKFTMKFSAIILYIEINQLCHSLRISRCICAQHYLHAVHVRKRRVMLRQAVEQRVLQTINIVACGWIPKY